VVEPVSEAAAILRAAAEVFVPGGEHDATPGAGDVAGELFIAHYLDFVMPGLAAGVPSLLTETAAQLFDGRAFVALTMREREQVLDALATHEVEQLREIPQALGILAVAAVYGEWSGQDAGGAMVRTPLGWQLTGFDGPVRARPELMQDL